MSEVPAFSTLNLMLSDNILDVQLNRPESANAMNAEMWVEIQQAFEWRTVVLMCASLFYPAPANIFAQALT